MSSASPCVKPVNEGTLQACQSAVLGEVTFAEVNTGPGATIYVFMAEKHNRLSEFKQGNCLQRQVRYQFIKLLNSDCFSIQISEIEEGSCFSLQFNFKRKDSSFPNTTKDNKFYLFLPFV